MDLAGRKVPSNYPLNGTVFGAGSKTPVFFAEGAAATGQQRGMVTARHLLLDAAAAMSPTTGKASATPIPGSAFAKVRLAEWWMFELDALPCQPVRDWHRTVVDALLFAMQPAAGTPVAWNLPACCG